jgi:8-amino-7-oxononanoate synthase
MPTLVSEVSMSKESRISLKARVSAHLADLDHQGLRRTLRVPTGLDLSSNDYLCLAVHPLLVERMSAAVLRDGCGSTGSRLLRGDRNCFHEIEHKFAIFKGVERSLYFSSGYLANQAVLTTFPKEGDVVFSDERNHASLIDGMRLSSASTVIFPHADPSVLGELLEAHPSPGQRFVVTESLFSMDGDIAPLNKYAGLCRSSGALLIVDEAHAVGIYGQDGSGLIKASGIGEDVFLSINTAGKALGVGGAFVAGPEWAIDALVQGGRSFIFSTAPPPSVAEALLAALEVIRSEPQRRKALLMRARYLRKQLVDAGVVLSAGESQIIPIIVGDNNRAPILAGKLQEEAFDVRAIRPPSVPPGTARLRVSVNTGLSESDLDRFVKSLRNCLVEI